MVSTTTATIIAGLLAILGTLLGVVVERLLRPMGRVTCEAEASYLDFVGSPEDTGGVSRRPWYELDEQADLHSLLYGVDIDFYNGKDAPTGLRDVRVELVLDGGKRFVDRPSDMSSTTTPIAQRRTGTIYDKLEVVNLPPRQFVHEELSGSFGKAASEACKNRGWRIEFVAQRPKRPLLWRKTYRTTITKPQAPVDDREDSTG